MKKLIEFLKTQEQEAYYVGNVYFQNLTKGKVLVTVGLEPRVVETKDELDDWLSGELGIEIRYCDRCGKPFNVGYTSESICFYTCEDCFEEYMDEIYGKEKWKRVDDDYCEGYYMYLDECGNWDGTGIYWTEW